MGRADAAPSQRPVGTHRRPMLTIGNAIPELPQITFCLLNTYVMLTLGNAMLPESNIPGVVGVVGHHT